MAYAEWKTGRADEIAVFEAFFRKAPFNGINTIFAGVDQIKRFLNDIRFTEQQIKYVRGILPRAEEEFFNWLRKLDCSKVQVSGI